MKIILVHDGRLLGCGLADALSHAGFEVVAVRLAQPLTADLTELNAQISVGADWLLNALVLPDPWVVETMSGAERDAWLSLQALLIERCVALGMGLFQLSSGYVFDGKKQGAYLSTNPGQPISTLGQMQWTWEQQVRASLKSYLILRTGWSADYWVRRLLALGPDESLKCSAKKMGHPVNLVDLIRVMTAMMAQVSCKPDLNGLYQYAGAEHVSQYELAIQIAQLLAERFQGRIEEGDGAGCMLEPANACLACIKIRNTFGIRPRPWRAWLSDDVARVLATVERQEAGA